MSEFNPRLSPIHSTSEAAIRASQQWYGMMEKWWAYQMPTQRWINFELPLRSAY